MYPTLTVTTAVVTFLFTLIKDSLFCWYYLSPAPPQPPPPPRHRSTGIVCVYVYIIMCYANNYVWWKLQTHRTCVERSKKSLWHSAPRSAMRERCGVQIKLKVLLQKCFLKTQSCCVTGDLCSFLFTCVLQHVTCFHKWFEAINPSMETALTFRTRAGIRSPGAELKPVKVPGDVIEVCSLTTGL